MDDQFQQICSGSTLLSQSVRQLVQSGFVIVPGPVSGDPFNELTAAYDELMAVAAGPDFKIASTTTRMLDLLNYASVFDDVYLHPPLLEACSHIIGEPFKLNSGQAGRLAVLPVGWRNAAGYGEVQGTTTNNANDKSRQLHMWRLFLVN